MDANEREKIGLSRRLRAGTESSGGTTTLIAANERKEVKISADYTDCADFGLRRILAVSDSGAHPRVSGLWVSRERCSLPKCDASNVRSLKRVR